MVKCGMCSASFVSIIHLKLHLPSHGGLRFICGEGECGRVFPSFKPYSKHLKQCHSDVNDSSTLNNKTVKNTTLPVDNECPVGNSDILDSGDNNSEGIDSVPDLPAADFQATYAKSVDMLVAKLYSNPGIPRNFVQTLIDDFDLFLNGGFVEILESKVLKALADFPVPEDTIDDIKIIFKSIKNPFEGLHSDYMRMEHFKASNYYVAPVTFTISESRPKTFNTRTGVVVKNVKTSGQFVPFRHVLKNLFELPEALSLTVQYCKHLKNTSDTGVISNVIQGNLWKDKISKFKDTDIVFPADFFYDEVEPNSALGPHSEKLGAGYLMLPALPPTCRSKLENIFLVLLIDSDDRKSTTPGKVSYNSEVFKPVIKEFNYLEESGIWVSTDDGQKQVFFVLNKVRGDNLGMHGILGFAEGFTANYPCIICRAPKELTWRMTREDVSLYRTVADYNADVARGKVSLTGIKEACVFNKVHSYHLVDNQSIDVMHDTAEGVCHYVMIPIIKHCIDSKYFSLSVLNSRLFFFDFGPSDSRNKPVPIADDFATKSKLKGTSAEIFSLVRIFGVLVGDLVPEDDPYWQLYKLHREMIEILRAKELPLVMSEQLSLIVHEHHSLYLKLVDRNLPPKFHYLLHSIAVLLSSGPPSHLSSERGEAQHRQVVTRYARAITSRRNLPLSVATKHQLSMCFRFLTKAPLIPPMVCGPGELIDLCDHVLFSKIKNKLPREMETVQRVNWVEIHGTKYQPRVVLVCDTVDSVLFKFGKLIDIFVIEGRALFICQTLKTLGFVEHVGGYEVVASNSYLCIFHENLLDNYPLYDFQMCSGNRYVVPKYYL